ncbi:MAG TPA: potassium-transporting ATPase subunit KdpA [Candidatus Acidoferrales bacterium]|nr:potassium-transporting ATPase subunit KdpA [Candidatus Acidoferrales bacterium]
MAIQIWLLPVLLLATAAAVAFPLSKYMAWIMDGEYRPIRIFAWFEKKLDSGHQDWKKYLIALLVFNVALGIFGFLVLVLQQYLPLNPLNRPMLAPSTILHTVISFMTNTDLQHYSGDQHFSNFSQLVFDSINWFLSAAIGLCSLTAIIRALRSDSHLGNFFVDMWRVMVYIFIPASFVFSFIFITQGVPMTLQSVYHLTTLESGRQSIIVGPVAALESIKMLGTNGGGFYGMNSAHPFENPTGLSNFFNSLTMLLFPFSLVFMFGRMLKKMRHAYVIFSVMLFLMVVTIVWTIAFDTYQPNPAFTSHPMARTYSVPSATAQGGTQAVTLPAVGGLPVDQHLGNLEGKEMRFGTSAGATFAALTVDVTCGAVNSEHDSLNPLAALSPMVGMWLNCIFGGKGVGMINMLLFIIIGIFVAGMMVGRSPEYLGKKIGAREIKLAIIALLVHPLMILMPTGLFAATDWGMKAVSNPGPHGLSQMFYQFSSASANNGSAFDGLGVTYGFYNNPNPASEAAAWDIATAIVIVISRFIPIIAPVAMAAFLGRKKSSPFSLGTLRTDTPTFGYLLLGTILIVGALLFLPIAVLGPIAEHLGPIPFGG